ncbi:5'-nucleotidase C-terminal domain-containing protein [Haloarculaceae archaeon H-GB2-1]|nr:5'-nucleotidase C-terminal domain-containing protein [Haloarculaceae archaeon H-GB11]MEA5408527.1 5'-nucleotidase C-terminal domain-containing protein [Haloarculaceae archaeon H-GB2-1]
MVVGTGDNTGPGVLSLVTDGRQSLDFFAAVRPDFETFGNHDFDYGLSATKEIVAGSPQTWVSANVLENGHSFASDAGVVPSAVHSVGEDCIGVVGVTDPATPSMTPQARDLDVTDPVSAVAEETGRLRERGIDHLVVMAHTGDIDRLARETAADAVLGGHVHEARIDEVDGTLIARPGANGRYVQELDLDAGTVTQHAVSEGPVNNTVAASLESRVAAAGLDETVATVDAAIERERHLRTRGECRLGNFVADAYRWATDADVALQNTGGLRRGPPLDGAVTVADLVGLVPFDQPVVVAELTGSELQTLAWQADGGVVDGMSTYWHAHVSGMSIAHDGERVAVSVDGRHVDPDETYTLATSDYLLGADHEFPVLTPDARVETGRTQYEVIVDYARERGIEPELEGRIDCRY